MRGKVYLIGAGPGDPELLTLKAARLLAGAEVVLHDALVHPEVLALAVKAELIPVGKRCGAHSTAQRFINKRLVDAARDHRVVIRLKGGDPMLFGRAHEEIEFLVGKGIAVQVVPGVTAAFAASADLGVSLTQRGKARSVAFVTPRVGKGMPESSWIRAALAADTVAIYMGAGEAEVIAKALLAAGKPASTPVAIVENASTPELRIDYATLAGLAQVRPGSGPALILLGEVYADAVEAAGRLARSASHAA